MLQLLDVVMHVGQSFMLQLLAVVTRVGQEIKFVCIW